MNDLERILRRAANNPYDAEALDVAARALRRHGFPQQPVEEKGGKPIWKSGETVLYVEDMDDQYLSNAIRMMERRAQELEKTSGIRGSLSISPRYQALQAERRKRAQRLELTGVAP